MADDYDGDSEVANLYGSKAKAEATPTATSDEEVADLYKNKKVKDDKEKLPETSSSWWDKAKAVGKEAVGSVVEPVLTAASGAVAKPLSDIAGLAATGYDAATGNQNGDAEGFKKDVQDRLTYRPRTGAGAAGVDILNKTVGAATEGVGNVASSYYGGAAHLLGASQPVEDAVHAGSKEAAQQGIGFLGAKKLGGEAPLDVPANAQAAADAVASKTSGGAAGAAVDTSKLLPDTQAELARLHAAGKAPNAKALSNIAEAESLPSPVRHTAGAATEDAALKSDEFNAKGKSPEIGKRFDENNQAMQDSLGTFHQEAAPGAVGNSEIQNGQGTLDSLKRYDAPKKQAITDAYQAAKDANGGDLQMDGSSFASNAEAALKPQGRANFLPSSVKGIIDNVKAADGKMSLDDFEGYRSQLANESAKAQRAGDGNAVAAIKSVRDSLEDTQPVGDTAKAAKAAYDKARGMAKARFGEMDADPAYKAAVEDDTPHGELSPLADKFNEKYVLNGSKANLQKLRSKLDDEGHEAMTSSSYNYLKDKSGASKGTFNQNGYNTALAKIRPKADELLGSSDRVEDAEKLGRVAQREQFQSRGSYANNSHTLVGALAKDAASGVHSLLPIPHVVNVLAGAGKSALAQRAASRSLRETLKPGAGLSD